MLLGEEEGANEVRLRGEEGEVLVVDVHHVGGGPEAVLLRREVWGGEWVSFAGCSQMGEGWSGTIEEGCWRQVAGG